MGKYRDSGKIVEKSRIMHLELNCRICDNICDWDQGLTSLTCEMSGMSGLDPNHWPRRWRRENIGLHEAGRERL